MKNYLLIPAIPLMLMMASCGGDTASNDVSNNSAAAAIIPASSTPVNEVLAEQGKSIFNAKCTSCHNFDNRIIGPALKGVSGKRSHEWLVNMIYKPEEMTKNDPIAKKMLSEYNGIQMTSMVNKEEAEAIVEYMKQMDI
ncbi:MAG: cytochrome c [Bacteroidetes bacterium]|nr:cytochrome c [Bacteroidota bacterium]